MQSGHCMKRCLPETEQISEFGPILSIQNSSETFPKFTCCSLHSELFTPRFSNSGKGCFASTVDLTSKGDANYLQIMFNKVLQILFWYKKSTTTIERQTVILTWVKQLTARQETQKTNHCLHLGWNAVCISCRLRSQSWRAQLRGRRFAK